jgi:DNA-binding response OmpR family regulator/Zn-dependent protease
MASASVPLGRLGELTLRVRASAAVLFAAITAAMSLLVLPAYAPGRPAALYWAAATAGSLVFEAGVLAHEAAHAAVARRCGLRVAEVALAGCGGRTTLAEAPPSPRVQAGIAAAGPAASLGVAGALAVATAVLAAAGAPGLVVGVGVYLLAANAVLALVNLLPGAPLDGGALLHSWLWHRCGDAERADRGSITAGWVIALVLFVGGTVLGFRAGTTGWWIAASGIALAVALYREAQQHALPLESAGPERGTDGPARQPPEAIVGAGGRTSEEGSKVTRVLLVEDDSRLVSALAAGLCGDGFAVDTAAEGTDGLAHAVAGEYDVIVLDIMLPGLSGYEVLRRMRARQVWTPVLMLTAKDGEYDEADALDLGADDYLSKPFSYVVLLAHLRALIRRGRPARPVQLTAGDLVLDPATRRARRGDTPLSLTPREFAVLEHLLAHRDEVCSKHDVLTSVWDEFYDGDPNIVEVYIGYLRRKIDAPFGRASIETVRGAGYRLRDDARLGPAAR